MANSTVFSFQLWVNYFQLLYVVIFEIGQKTMSRKGEKKTHNGRMYVLNTHLIKDYYPNTQRTLKPPQENEQPN